MTGPSADESVARQGARKGVTLRRLFLGPKITPPPLGARQPRPANTVTDHVSGVGCGAVVCWLSLRLGHVPRETGLAADTRWHGSDLAPAEALPCRGFFL